jgi:uncharacterized protein (TIGR02996 family)
VSDDDTFLRAIAERPADDAPRLVYADWLDERGDPRSRFLRVQWELGRPVKASARFRELCESEQELARQLDPAWVQRVRRYTTPAPCRDITKLVPDLIPYARRTTRLHPHRAVGRLPEWASKIGGRFLWPTEEPWPTCSLCGVHLAPILQLRASDAPDIRFPAGTDLLQLFWCPDEDAHDYQPAPRAWWRTTAEVLQPRTDDPDLCGFPRVSDWQGYIPFECGVYPEPVVE